MFFKRFIRNIRFCFLCIIISVTAQNSIEIRDFIESFINHYECNPEGRYTHEYHPYLLHKTADSLQNLTHELEKSGFRTLGRVIIFGYEENAVPSYYTDFTRSHIDDEDIVKNKVGWSLRLHNRFGFMTSFLLKDFNILSEKIYCDLDPIFEHVDVDQIPIFDNRAEIFQEHAFGESLDLIQRFSKSVIKEYAAKNIDGILKNLVNFWEIVYVNALKVGNKQIAGTQDILFSVEYVKGLLDSRLPIFKFFIGPDLTYPIEISCKQKKDATRHAQAFVRKLVRRLVPIEGEKTAYIFCSFVDGVGKSTMLGNIKNWITYGDNVDAFGHVDNTSSQLAEIFKFNEDVYIVDLPAQISHFTYKPDGFVYVAVENELSEDQIENLRNYVKEGKEKLVQQYDALVKRVYELLGSQGYLALELNDVSRPEYWFIKNLFLLKKLKNNNFIPFFFQGQHYIFHLRQINEIKLLKRLETVKSEGLKNIESEQMIFSLGIRFPATYKFFLSDLINKLKDTKVKNIVFVDFLSMYPRSSRENLRVNYLLQQLSLIYPDFNPRYSFYRDFVSGGELLQCLLKREDALKIKNSLEYEAILRFILFKLSSQHQIDGVNGISLTEMTELIKKELEKSKFLDCLEFLHSSTFKKLRLEIDNLEKVYGLSKSFVNIQQFSFKHVLEFSTLLSEFFASQINNEQLNSLWEDCGDVLDDEIDPDSCACNFGLFTDLGAVVKALFIFESECRCEIKLSPFLRMLRSNWYAAITNLLNLERKINRKSDLEKEFIRALPCFLKVGLNGCIYLLQKVLPVWSDKVPREEQSKFLMFNLQTSSNPAIEFGSFNDLPYRIDWCSGPTNIGVFQFDCDLNEIKQKGYGSPISLFVRKYQSEHDNSTVITTSGLWEILSKSVYWKYTYDLIKNSAERNGFYDLNQDTDFKTDIQNIKKVQHCYMNYGRVVRIYLGLKQQRYAAKMFIRLITTLEMILKDPDSDIIVRFGNRDDFKAAIKLIEAITLPNYFGILFKDPLFKDYDRVEPYPSWDFWDGI